MLTVVTSLTNRCRRDDPVSGRVSVNSQAPARKEGIKQETHSLAGTAASRYQQQKGGEKIDKKGPRSNESVGRRTGIECCEGGRENQRDGVIMVEIQKPGGCKPGKPEKGRGNLRGRKEQKRCG